MSNALTTTINRTKEISDSFVHKYQAWVLRPRLEASEEYKTYTKDALLGNVFCMEPITPCGKKIWNEMCIILNLPEKKVHITSEEDTNVIVASSSAATTIRDEEEIVKITPEEMSISTSEDDAAKNIIQKLIRSVDYNSLIVELLNGSLTEEKVSEVILNLINNNREILSGIVETQNKRVVIDDKLVNAVKKMVSGIMNDPEFKYALTTISALPDNVKGEIAHVISTFVDELKDNENLSSTNLREIAEAKFDNLKMVIDQILQENHVVDADFEEVEDEDDDTSNPTEQVCHFEHLDSVIQDPETGKLVDTRDEWTQEKESILSKYPRIKPFVDILDKYGFTARFQETTGSIYADCFNDGQLYKKFVIGVNGPLGPFTCVNRAGNNYPVMISDETLLDKLVREVPFTTEEIEKIKSVYGGANPMEIANRFSLETLPPKMEKRSFKRLCSNLINIETMISDFEKQNPKSGFHKFDFISFKSAGNFVLSDQNSNFKVTFVGGKVSVTRG